MNNHTTIVGFYKDIEKYLDDTTYQIIYKGSMTYLGLNGFAQVTYGFEVVKKKGGASLKMSIELDPTIRLQLPHCGHWSAFRRILEADDDVQRYRKLKLLAQVISE
ncbi:MAG: hypothetical protein EOO61_05595 [Hymenobacter sp.]|nr:MAG: hypothetical protein EOO61_05595 [Hymenobacter sp.]